MIYHGACHCGAVRAEYETNAAVQLRQDGCSFCSSRGVKSASDPDGRLELVSQVRLTTTPTVSLDTDDPRRTVAMIHGRVVRGTAALQVLRSLPHCAGAAAVIRRAG